MFHTYVTTSAGAEVDIDRASFLMDKALFNQALFRAQHSDQESACFDLESGDNPTLPGRVWYWYCQFHYEKYGEPFKPDIDPNWDQ